MCILQILENDDLPASIQTNEAQLNWILVIHWLGLFSCQMRYYPKQSMQYTAGFFAVLQYDF